MLRSFAKYQYGPDRKIPAPITNKHEALEQAAYLHSLGGHWSWPAIADAMRLYHGYDRNITWWRRQLRAYVPARSRGNAFGPKRRAA